MPMNTRRGIMPGLMNINETINALSVYEFSKWNYYDRISNNLYNYFFGISSRVSDDVSKYILP